MLQVLSSYKKYTKKQVNQEDKRVLYCVESSDRSETMEKSQLITIYDLDNNGILRVGFPGNPFASNMFFGRVNEVDFYDEESLNKLKASGKKAVQTKYFHAFNKIEDLNSITDRDAVVVSFDRNTQIVSSIDLYEKTQNIAKVAKK